LNDAQIAQGRGLPGQVVAAIPTPAGMHRAVKMLTQFNLTQLNVEIAKRRPALARAADAAAAAVAASLPWSTSATGILLVVWLGLLLPTLDAARLRREITTAAGGLPLVLVALAALGMSWADSWAEVGMSQRLAGLGGYLKLLCIPLLFAQFRASPRGTWVIFGFLGAAVALLVLSFGLTLIPDLPWRGKTVGVPVKDYITQSGVFALCAFALFGAAAQAWRCRRLRTACALAFLAMAFIANIGFVETGRTTLAAIAVLVPLFGFRYFGWPGMAAAIVVGSVLAGGLWITSPYLRERVTHAVAEVDLYRTEHAGTSAGLRLEFWRNSLAAVAKAPILGNGTGSIPEQLAAGMAREPNGAYFGTVNPHNELLVVTIQLGLVGTAALLSLWIAHLILFRGDGLVAWIGLVAVAENIVGSLFNSHLSDFTQGWIYVLAVGALGGTVLRQAAPPKGAETGPADLVTAAQLPHP
jgi:O-antigen ligase